MGQYGHVIIDECHHVPSSNFENVMRHVKARYVVGLSATVIRKDGHHPIITMRCGPILYRVNAKDQAMARPFEHHVIVRPTAFRPIKPIQDDLRLQFQDLTEELVHDVRRNELICNDVLSVLEKNRSPIVLTERNEHLDILFDLLSPKIPNILVLRGGLSKREMTLAIEQLNMPIRLSHTVI